MAIVLGMFWIILGVCYILYKIGSDECNGGIFGGIIMILIPPIVIAIIAIPAWLASYLFGNEGLIAYGIIALIVLLVFKFSPDRKERKKKQEEQSDGGFHDNP